MSNKIAGLKIDPIPLPFNPSIVLKKKQVKIAKKNLEITLKCDVISIDIAKKCLMVYRSLVFFHV